MGTIALSEAKVDTETGRTRPRREDHVDPDPVRAELARAS
jgi:hypothetical protein